MGYQRSVITRLFTRVVGRVATGFLSDCRCLDEAKQYPPMASVSVVSVASFLSDVSDMHNPVYSNSHIAFSQQPESMT